MRFSALLIAILTASSAQAAAPKAKPASTKAAKAAPKAEEPAPEAEKPALPALVSLGEIDTEADEKMTNVTVRLDIKPEWSAPGEIQDHGSFLQVVLPDVLVPEPGKFIEADSPYIKKIAVFQLNQKDAGVRFFVAADAALTKQATSVVLLDKRIVLTIDHDKLKTLLPAALAGAPSGADAVIAKTEVRSDIPAPADLLRKDAMKPVPGVDMRDKLTTAAIFSGGMMILLAMSLMLKPYFRRRNAKAAGVSEQQVSMKTLANMPLAARQRLQLIQIGDERILIGVTADSINYITTVGKQAYGMPMQMPLQMQPPQAQMPRTFGKMIADAQAAEELEMKPARPMLKNMEGNDEASLRQPAPPPPAPRLPPRQKPAAPAPEPEAPRPRAARLQTKASRVNIAVGEDGVRDLNRSAADQDPKGIDDVTRLIREKLKTLRTI